MCSALICFAPRKESLTRKIHSSGCSRYSSEEGWIDFKIEAENYWTLRYCGKKHSNLVHAGTWLFNVDRKSSPMYFTRLRRKLLKDDLYTTCKSSVVKHKERGVWSEIRWWTNLLYSKICPKTINYVSEDSGQQLHSFKKQEKTSTIIEKTC